MRILFFLILNLLVSCAISTPVRLPAAETDERYDEFDKGRSYVQIFPASSKDTAAYFLYVQLRDAEGRFVDAFKEQFALKTGQGEPISFEFERLLVGRYYLTIPKKEDVLSHQIYLYVQGKPLKGLMKLSLKRPVQKHTAMKLVEKYDHQIIVELRIADEKNIPVEVPETPEILLEGHGNIEYIKKVSAGIWHFSVRYPEGNQIIYFGARTLGVTFQNLYRFQHVEK